MKPAKHNLFMLDTLCYYLRCGSYHVNLPLYSVKVKPMSHTALIRVWQKCTFYTWYPNDVHTASLLFFLLRWLVPRLKAALWSSRRCLCPVWMLSFQISNTWKKNPQKVGFSLSTLACLHCKASHFFFTVHFAARGKKSLGHRASLSISYARVRPSSVLFCQ